MNKFFTAFEAAHVSSAKAATKSESNQKKINAIKNMLAKKQVSAFLNASNVDAACFSRALYMTEKLTSFAAVAVELDDTLTANVAEAFKTAMLCAKHNEQLTKRDIEASLLADVKIDEARAHLVYHRATKISATAQVQQVIDMLKSLRIIKEVAKDKFAVTVNDAAKRMIERLAIDMTVATNEQATA
jgi:hypothetical protein